MKQLLRDTGLRLLVRIRAACGTFGMMNMLRGLLMQSRP